MSLGKELLKLREAAKLTQEQAADIAGISDSYLSQLENDKKNPSARTLEGLARAYNREFNDLLQIAGYKIDKEGRIFVDITKLHPKYQERIREDIEAYYALQERAEKKSS